MKVRDIAATMEHFAPAAFAEGYDNVGLMVGDTNSEVSSVLLSLDVTERVVDEAIESGAQMIVAHHPLIFSPLKSLTGSNDIERAVIKSIRAGIAIFCAHTNADSVVGGVSHRLAKELGVQELSILEVRSIPPRGGSEQEYLSLHHGTDSVGFGVYGTLAEPVDAMTFLSMVKQKLGLKSLRHSQPHVKMVQKIAMCGGSGASLISKAKSVGADIYLTGDIKYHDYFQTEEAITIADIGHYESEIFILDVFEELLRELSAKMKIARAEHHETPIRVL